jgi:hypothetical protein
MLTSLKSCRVEQPDDQTTKIPTLEQCKRASPLRSSIFLMEGFVLIKYLCGSD